MSARRSIYWFTPIVRRLAVLVAVLAAVTVAAFIDTLGNWSLLLLAVLAWGCWYALMRKERRP